MWKRHATFKRSASGVTKIRRDTYNTVNGFSKKNSWWEISAQVRKRDKGLCVPCARKLGLKVKGIEVHHIVPLSKGGKTTMANLILLCKDCHDRRHNHLYRVR